MDYTPNRRFLDEYRRSSPELHDILQDKVDGAASYWAARTRKETGRLAEQTTAIVFTGPDGLEGLFQPRPFYAGFQERGTEHIEGQYVIPEIIQLIEDGDI